MIERETATAKFYYYPEDTILYVVYKNDFKMTIKEAKEQETLICNLLEKPCIFILDASYTDGIFTREAQDYVSNSEAIAQYRSYYIFIIKNLAQRITANFYGSLNKKNNPFKVVKSKDAAFDLAKKK